MPFREVRPLKDAAYERRTTEQPASGKHCTFFFWLLASFALLGAILLPSPAIAADFETNPQVITALAADAYVWGLGPEYIERFSKYNTIIGAPFNVAKYGNGAAAWNNEGTNAGDASVLYASAFVNFGQSSELVLTVPPSRNQYYILAYYDAYANSIGSIGTRTTPSDSMTSYLFVGPDSPYAHLKVARINGYDYPVMASDTNLNWFLIRILANTLIAASDPTSVPNAVNDVVRKFALNTLADFEKNGHQPVFPASFVLPPPTQQQQQDAAPYQNAPADAVTFFSQLGNLVATNPIPGPTTALSGTRLADLPSYVVPQDGAKELYVVPSFGQQTTFDRFAPIGLTAQGFTVPASWGPAQLQALEQGMKLGQNVLQDVVKNVTAGADTNYWGIVNDPVGTYPNNLQGYIYRSVIVVEGGVANIGLDAIYPALLSNPSTLDGNQTYRLTFLPPALANPTFPVAGIYPPMVSDSNGNPKGFWSVSAYAVDPTQGAAPFIAQTSVLNTTFSTADLAVFSVDPAADAITVTASNWGTLFASTPILFGENAAAYGLKPNTVYYVATTPTQSANGTAYTFKVSTQWIQDLSSGNVPIQGAGGKPGPIADLQSPPNAGALTYGVVKPVTQLGSSQLAANQLAKNNDGSLTLWFGPKLPAGAPASNWIPTPSTSYYRKIYGHAKVSTTYELILRMYYPTPGTEPPSILPCTQACPTPLPQSYVPPALVQVP